MGSDTYNEVIALARDVQELLVGVGLHSLQLKPNSYEPTVAESLALALLELDRISAEPGFEFGALPTFASDFLNRRLSKRLLERYQGSDLPVEFERRLTDALERVANSRVGDRSGPALERIHRLLSELESALLQSQGSVDQNPER